MTRSAFGICSSSMASIRFFTYRPSSLSPSITRRRWKNSVSGSCLRAAIISRSLASALKLTSASACWLTTRRPSTTEVYHSRPISRTLILNQRPSRNSSSPSASAWRNCQLNTCSSTWRLRAKGASLTGTLIKDGPKRTSRERSSSNTSFTPCMQ